MDKDRHLDHIPEHMFAATPLECGNRGWSLCHLYTHISNLMSSHPTNGRCCPHRARLSEGSLEGMHHYNVSLYHVEVTRQ